MRKLCIVKDPNDQVADQPPVEWAIGELETALREHNISLRHCESVSQTSPEEMCIAVAGRESELARAVSESASISVPDSAESLGLIPGKLDDLSILLACGSDVCGLVYAVLELTDRVLHTDDPSSVFTLTSPVVEQPVNDGMG